ncbi:RICIN domain-containing protein [Hymenobacter coccineus]|uniref:Ricin B lectin domain-containing protein n=1 Tax=Hymenobacter coccineus TaxID=1908235 RepID=A0A1G1THK5_9BACT|nr:RICIN domain-containing protein [Hymenobacter coccineus]OGX90338.1 hypothetical protein BEN49_23120 [Hymenobacter coccineus]
MKNIYLFLVSLSCVLLLPFSGLAQFNALPGHVYKFVNHANGQVLEMSGPGLYIEDYDASLAVYTGRANQQWLIAPSTNSRYKITNRNSNLVLALRYYSNASYGGEYLTVPANQQVFTGSIRQEWAIIPVANSSSFILTNHADVYGKLVNLPSGLLSHSRAAAVEDGEKWDIVDVSENPASGVFTLQTRNNNKVLGHNSDNDQVRQVDGMGTANQQWIFSPYLPSPYLYAGQLSIIDRYSRQVLQVNGTGNNSYVTAANNNGGANQQWTLRDIYDSHVLTVAEATDGRTFKIYSYSSQKVLGIQDGSQDEGRLATVYDDLGRLWQQWHIPTNTITANRGPSAATAPSAAGDVLTLYPNPVRDVLFVALPGTATPTAVRIIDARGRAVTAHCKDGGRLDVADLAAGTYSIIVSVGKTEYHQKFVKE